MNPIRKIQVRAEGDKVLVNINDDTFLELEWQKADELACALRASARMAEAYSEADRLIRESALLMRSGAPFTLSDDSRILDAARNEAAFGTKLRRQMPGGVKSEAVVGTPSILLKR